MDTLVCGLIGVAAILALYRIADNIEFATKEIRLLNERLREIADE